MGIERNRDRVVARIRQAITQSGVDLSAVPANQQERMISTMADHMLLEFDSWLDEIDTKQAATGATKALVDEGVTDTAGSFDEQVLWEGRPLLSLTERYVITNDRIRLFTGLLSKQVENLELVRLQDVDYHQGLSERVLNIGDITLHSADPSNPEIVLRNVKDPEGVHAVIRRAWLEARKRHGVYFREEM